MLSSVQGWFQETLDGLVSPQMQPLQAVVAPPVDVESAYAPICYIWAADGSEARVSAPRPKAWQKITWQVDLAVMAAMDLDDPNQATAFPLLLDKIVATLNTVAMPFVLTDPVTGFQTQMLAVGEKLSIRYARIRTTGSTGEALVAYGAELRCTAEEDVSYLSGLDW